jgi:tetratricopeptide (TPR) repeat protein
MKVGYQVAFSLLMALTTGPVFAQTQEQLDWCYGKDSAPEKTVDGCTAVIQSGTKTGKDLALAFAYRGFVLLKRGKLDSAIQDFGEAIRLDPIDANTRINRCTAYSFAGRFDQAIEDCSEAIRLNPKIARTFVNRGFAYRNKGDYDNAIKDYGEAIRLDPKLAIAYNGRGKAYGDKGDYDNAIKDYDRAIELNPNYADAFNGRGVAHARKGEYDRAIADFDQAIRLDPQDKFPVENRALAVEKSRKPPNALQQAIERSIEAQGVPTSRPSRRP